MDKQGCTNVGHVDLTTATTRGATTVARVEARSRGATPESAAVTACGTNKSRFGLAVLERY